MIKLKELKVLGREIRQDDISDLAIPTLVLIREAIRAGRKEEALSLVEYEFGLDKTQNDNFADFMQRVLTHLSRFGEDEVMKALRDRCLPKVKDWLATTPGVVESLQRCTEIQRHHQGNLTVTEEPEKYVVKCDPCGSGGRLRRTQKDIAVMKRSYPWSWNQAGIPYYCIHCSLQWEILPIELRGYPIRINLIGAKPEDPCVHLFYKNPDNIPPEYYSRIGKSKP